MEYSELLWNVFMKAILPLKFFVAVLVCLPTANEVLAETEAAQAILKPLVAMSGTDSRIQQASFLRVSSTKELMNVWARHLGTAVDDYYRPLFEVDFDRCLVIAIFLGERIQIRRMEIESVSEKGDAIVIRFWAIGYAISLGPNDKPAPPERPYTFVVLPKSDKEILLEEKIWTKEDTAKNRPPQWKEIARMKPPKTVSSQPRRKL